MKRSLYDPRYTDLVARLIERRRNLGMTQSQAARRAHMTRNQLGKIERRETGIDLVVLIRLCHTYGLHLHELVREMEEGEPDFDEPFSLPIRQQLCLSDMVPHRLSVWQRSHAGWDLRRTTG